MLCGLTRVVHLADLYRNSYHNASGAGMSYAGVTMVLKLIMSCDGVMNLVVRICLMSILPSFWCR